MKMLNSGEERHGSKALYLHNAAYHCHHKQLETLIELGAPLDCRDRNGETALHAAVRGNCLISVRRLAQANVDINAMSVNEWTPLMLAARYGYASIVRLLIDFGVEFNLQGFHGWTALHLAYRHRAIDAVTMLLKAGANADAKDNDGIVACNACFPSAVWGAP